MPATAISIPWFFTTAASRVRSKPPNRFPIKFLSYAWQPVAPSLANTASSKQGNESQLARAVFLGKEAGMTVAHRGGATKLDWGNPPNKVNLILSTARLNRIVEHAWADLTVTAEAGCTLQSLQHTLAQHGQRLAFDGLWPERATIGGVLPPHHRRTPRPPLCALPGPL